MMRGRWGALSTAKIYAEEGLKVRDAEQLSELHKNKVVHWCGTA